MHHTGKYATPSVDQHACFANQALSVRNDVLHTVSTIFCLSSTPAGMTLPA